MIKDFYRKKMIRKMFKKEPFVTDAFFMFFIVYGFVLFSQSFSFLGKMSSLVVSLGLFVLPLLYAFFWGWDCKSVFGIKKPQVLYLLGGSLIAIGLQICSFFICTKIFSVVSKMPFFSVGLESLVLERNFLLGFLLVVALPSLCEESLFRGFFVFVLHKMNTKKIIFLCAFLFALLHLDPYRFVFVFIAGCFLTWLRIKSGSVFVPMWAHFVHNAVPFLVLRNKPNFLQTGLGWRFVFFVCLGGILFVLLGILLCKIPCNKSCFKKESQSNSPNLLH